MEWQNPDGSLTRGVIIEDGAGNKITSFSGGGGNGGGSNASVGANGSAAPSSATEIGFVNALGNLTPIAPSNPLPITAATALTTSDSGVSITGAAMPGGGSGLTGWLSAIWSKLSGTLATSRTWTLSSGTDSVSATISNGSLAVTGTFYPATQPVSLTALPALSAGANLIGAVNLDIGGAAVSQSNRVPTAETYANIATGQVSVASTATLIVAARTGRKEVTIVNNSTTAVYLGASSVTASSGLLLAGVVGEGITITGGAAIFGITATGSETVSYLEVY